MVVMKGGYIPHAAYGLGAFEGVCWQQQLWERIGQHGVDCFICLGGWGAVSLLKGLVNRAGFSRWWLIAPSCLFCCRVLLFEERIGLCWLGMFLCWVHNWLCRMSDFKFSTPILPLRNRGAWGSVWGWGRGREVALLYAGTNCWKLPNSCSKVESVDAVGGSVNGSRNSYDLVCLPPRWPGYSDGWHMILWVAIICPLCWCGIAAGWISTQLGGWRWVFNCIGSAIATVCSSTSPLAAVSPVSVRLPSWHQYLPHCLATCSSVKFLVRFSGRSLPDFDQHLPNQSARNVGKSR